MNFSLILCNKNHLTVVIFILKIRIALLFPALRLSDFYCNICIFNFIFAQKNKMWNLFFSAYANCFSTLPLLDKVPQKFLFSEFCNKLHRFYSFFFSVISKRYSTFTVAFSGNNPNSSITR